MKKLTKKGLETRLDKLCREIVLRRDGYRCQVCSRPMEKGLNAHHIFSRHNKNMRWLTENMIALCPNHHKIGTNSVHNSPAEFLVAFQDKYPDVYDYILTEYRKPELKYYGIKVLKKILAGIEEELDNIKRGYNMLDIEKYKYFLSMTAKKYSYLGYGDVYNELVTYLLQAQRDGVKDPQSYAMNRLKTFIRKETKARKVINYGLKPKG